MSSTLLTDSNNCKIPETIFTIDISKHMGNEYVGFFNDLSRFLMIQIGIQIMLCMADPNKFSVFNQEFIVLLIFIIIGLMFYWLILRKIVYFT